MRISKPRRRVAGELIRKLRKPLAPPTRIIKDTTKYSRKRERERQRREIAARMEA